MARLCPMCGGTVSSTVDGGVRYLACQDCGWVSCEAARRIRLVFRALVSHLRMG